MSIKYYEYTKSPKNKTLLLWTPQPPPRNRLLVKHDVIGTNALQNAEKEWIWNHLWNLKCMLHSVPHGAKDLPRIRRMSAPVLVNKNIVVDRYRHCNLRLWRRVDDDRMGYTVEPPDVPIRMPPRLVVRDWVTPMLLGNEQTPRRQQPDLLGQEAWSL